ncbi:MULTISPECIES: hybrid sensor histidine kinase/response regulator [Deefgea]|uniref:histidine kinase n=1 Tax=Deefgea chitinilytica TaxID=570276 RepID=A0ABS2C8X0_9NEIS|nr:MULTISPECIES: ATP-binding protein [Deefgea]MBM5570588.1 response regulator [Deefgea chitinilytica]MBM9887817.1 response regulator [Deefgea sp. CFH1-16]
MYNFKYRTLCIATVAILAAAFALILSYELKAQAILKEFNTPEQQKKLRDARSANKEYSFFERALTDYQDNPSDENRAKVQSSYAIFASRINDYQSGAFPSLSNNNPQVAKHLPPIVKWLELTTPKINKLSPEQIDAITTSADRMSPNLRQVVNALDARYSQILDAKKNKVMGLLKDRTALNVVLLGVMLIFSFVTLRTLWRNQKTLLQLKEAEQKAQTANQAKSHFLASISHEMRTPLTTILGYAELMKKMDHQPQIEQKYLEHIIHASHHLQTLLGNVLDMSKIEAGHFVLNESTLDTSLFINELQGMFGPLAEKKGLTLIIAADPQLPALVALDAVKWRQILLNLLSNAIKFSDAGEVRCTLSCKPRQNNQVELIAIVSDQGLGISPAEAPMVFSPFEQTQSGLFKGGTGLGLALSKEFAQKMGGNLSFTSQVFAGSTFTATALATIQTHAQIEPRINSQLNGLVILLVEDQDINRELMRQILCNANATVLEAEHGKKALDILAQNPQVNAMVIDRNMPELDGIATIEAMRLQGHFLPTLMVSAGLQPSSEEIQRIGLNGWLGKPFTESELIDSVARITQSVHSQYQAITHDEIAADEFESSRYFNPEAPHRLGFSAERFAALSQKGLHRIDEILSQLAQRPDAAECCRLAHSGKGIALQIGADRIAQLLEQIEIAEGQFHTEQLSELVAEMKITHLAVQDFGQHSQFLPPSR